MPDNNSTLKLRPVGLAGGSAITQKIWSMCGVLYDDGVSYIENLETALESFKALVNNLDTQKPV